MRLVLAAALALLPALALAKPPPRKSLPPYGTFVYSSLCWGKESGDAGGARFELSRTREGARLTYEYGNGPLEGARIASLRGHGDTFEAEASTDDGDLSISATLGPRTATLSEVYDHQTDRPPHVHTLKRIRRFKQTIPQCR